MREMKLILHKRRILLWQPGIRAVCMSEAVILNDSLYREMKSKYGWFTVRIRTASILFRNLIPLAVNSSVKIAKESSGGMKYDIRADASFRMEVINQFKQLIFSQGGYHLSYQDMVVIFSILRQNYRGYEPSIPASLAITKKDIKNMFLKMMEQAYISYLQGGRKGLKTWMMYQDTSYVLKIPDEDKIHPVYLGQTYRYEKEKLIYNFKEQERMQKELETQRIYQSQVLETFQKKMVENNRKDMERIVERQVNQWAGGLSEKVYQKMEKKLDNERKRRGF